MLHGRHQSRGKMLMKVVLVVVAVIVIPINCSQSEKIDEGGAVPAPPALGIMCTMCSSCDNPCNQHPPPPPALPPPPPPPKNPTGQYCPPPPPPPFFYFTGPPGDLYPIEPDHFRSAAASQNYAAWWVVPSLLGYFGLLGLWIF